MIGNSKRTDSALTEHFMKKTIILIGSALLPWLGSIHADEKRPEKPNILLLLTDDLAGRT